MINSAIESHRRSPYGFVCYGTEERALLHDQSKGLAVDGTGIVFLDEFRHAEKFAVECLTLAHSVMQDKQYACSQFSGMPTS